jgi:O-antigen/teichoic acid export membrane protein
MSRSKNFLSGVSFGYASQIVMMVAGLWLTPFLLQRIGHHDYGLWLVGIQILFYLGLMDFGVVALLPRETAYATGRIGTGGQREQLPVLIGQTARLVLWQMPVVVVGALAIWFLMPAEWEPLRQPLGVVLLAFVLMFPLRIFQAVLQGLQDLRVLAQTQLLTWLASMALTVALIFAGFGLYALVVGWAATQLLAVPVLLYRFKRRFPGVLPRTLPRLPWTIARTKLINGFWVSLNQIAVVLLVGTDVLIIGKLLGPAAVVPYVCTGKLMAVLANQPQMLMQVAMPGLSELRARQERERLSGVCIALSQSMLLASGAVVCVVLATNQGFVSWWVGAKQFGGFLLTMLVLMNMLLRHLNLSVAYILFSFGRERRLAVASLLDGFFTVCSAIVLTRMFGFVGAALSLVIGVCLVSLPSNLTALASADAVPVSRLLKSLGPWFWRFAILALAAGGLAQRFTPNTFPKLAATTVVIAGVYAVVMLPIVWRDPLGQYVRPRLTPLATKLFSMLHLSAGILARIERADASNE